MRRVLYIASADRTPTRSVPVGCWVCYHEDLDTTAGRERELRTDMIASLCPGDCVRTTSVRAFCDGPQDLERLVREIIVDHKASIEFVHEHVTVEPGDLDHLDVILRSLAEDVPWKPMPGPIPVVAVKFGPVFREAFIKAAEATRQLRLRGYQNTLYASEKLKGR